MDALNSVSNNNKPKYTYMHEALVARSWRPQEEEAN